jgi:hypothetical protein
MGMPALSVYPSTFQSSVVELGNEPSPYGVSVSVTVGFQHAHDVDRRHDDDRMLIFLDLSVRLAVDETRRHQDTELRGISVNFSAFSARREA